MFTLWPRCGDGVYRGAGPGVGAALVPGAVLLFSTSSKHAAGCMRDELSRGHSLFSRSDGEVCSAVVARPLTGSLGMLRLNGYKSSLKDM